MRWPPTCSGKRCRTWSASRPNLSLTCRTWGLRRAGSGGRRACGGRGSKGREEPRRTAAASACPWRGRAYPRRKPRLV
eukprot:3763007-Prymnesium_polylepis.1